MSPRTELRSETPARFRFTWWPIAVVVLFVGVCLALLFTSRALSPGSFVGHITVENRSEYAIDVRAAGASRDARTPVGTAQPNSVTTFTDVYDEGDAWVLTFAYDRFETEVTMTAADLRRAAWHVRVPDDLIARLHAAHTPPTPVLAH